VLITAHRPPASCPPAAVTGEQLTLRTRTRLSITRHVPVIIAREGIRVRLPRPGTVVIVCA